MKGNVFYVPLDVATTPIDGECLTDSWWAYHPDKGLAFYYSRDGMRWAASYGEDYLPSPQCNRDERTARALHKRLYPDHECIHVSVVFITHAVKAMRAHAREQFEQQRATP